MCDQEIKLKEARQFISDEIVNWKAMRNKKLDTEQHDEVAKMIVSLENVQEQLKYVKPPTVMPNYPPGVR